MRATIDAAGRLVVPKPVRDELGFAAGTELELRVVDEHLEVAVPSRIRVEEGPHGVRFVAEGAGQPQRGRCARGARTEPALTADTTTVIAAMAAWHGATTPRPTRCGTSTSCRRTP